MIKLRTLVLNSNFMPMSVFPLYTIPVEKAIQLIIKDVAFVVYEYDRVIKTPSRTDLHWPSVIANKNTYKYKDYVKLKDKTLFYRDHGVCAYCDSPLDMDEISIDHVLPKSKGGKHHWNNVVASCHECNQQKADSLPVGKWKPKRTPYTPDFYQLLQERRKHPIVVYDRNWMQFLPEWIGEVKVIENESSLVEQNDKFE